MAFDYVKFLTENKLTLSSRLAERDEKAQDIQSWGDEIEDLPDVKSAGAQDTIRKSTIKAGKSSGKLAKLIRQKDEILAQYKSGAISLDQYRTKIGNIPQQIKQLRAAADSEAEPDYLHKASAGADQEPEDDKVYAGDDQAPEEEETSTSWDQPENDEDEL